MQNECRADSILHVTLLGHVNTIIPLLVLLNLCLPLSITASLPRQTFHCSTKKLFVLTQAELPPRNISMMSINILVHLLPINFLVHN